MLSKPGALDGLMASFNNHGLGSIVQSSVSTGHNPSISAAQVQQVLGSGMLGELAAKAGMQALDAASALSHLLPQVVDKPPPRALCP